MRENTIVILAFILVLIILGASFGLGYFWGQKKLGPGPITLLDSKLINSWIAFGEGKVQEVSGQDLVLSTNGETLKIAVSEKTRIQKLNPATQKTEKANFEDIKVGSKLSFQLNLMQKEKLLLGDIIVILP